MDLTVHRTVGINTTTNTTYLPVINLRCLAFIHQTLFSLSAQTEGVTEKPTVIKCLGTYIYENKLSLIDINQTANECIDQRKIDGLLMNHTKGVEGQATLVIWTGSINTQWSGSIMDTGFDSATVGGQGDDKINFACERGGIYSVAIQLEDYGGLWLLVIQDGKLLDTGRTSQQYGLVSISGTCGAPS